MRIVAFDPGAVTGFCEALVSSDGTIQVVKSQEIAWANRFSGVHGLLRGIELGTRTLDPDRTFAPLPDVIVVEAFHLYAHRAKEQIGNDFPSVKMMGVIETYAFELGILDKIIYQPASVMSRVTILTEHVPSIARSEHARDAYRHLRYYVVMHPDKFM